MKKISIMVIDDHTLFRESLVFLLNDVENFEVIAECGDGQRAIELVKDKRPDIVLLDINMEPLNGIEVLKMIRKFSPTSRIIGVSMHSEPAYAKRLLRLGAKGFVTKNSPRDEMVDAVNAVSKGNIFICVEVKNLLSRLIIKDGFKDPDINSLSGRELQILGLLSAGGSSKEIAAELEISCKTVEVHRHNILKKMKMKSTLSLVNYINSHAVEV